jgi:branched-chain amino acid transport system ATP-binding protein
VIETLPLVSQFTMHRRLASISDIGQRAAGLLTEFGLSHVRDELARNLAYSDQRKLEVSLSMAGRPRLLLLDEPMAGLSTDERDSMLTLLKALDPATAVLLIEHDIDVRSRSPSR